MIIIIIKNVSCSNIILAVSTKRSLLSGSVNISGSVVSIDIKKLLVFHYSLQMFNIEY